MNQPYILRTVIEDDIDVIFQLAAAETEPITTFPADRDYLSKRIHDSLRSLYPVIHQPGPESYLFVLEDTRDGGLHGISAIFARTGGYEAFYTYEIKNHLHEHPPLQVSNNVQALHLKLDHKGPSEIGSLYLAPDVRKRGLGKLMSLARFLFMAQFPTRFADEVIVELRGVVDEHGKSPFWEALGKHFFGCDYMTADSWCNTNDKSFLQDQMPRHPIYIPLLPEVAQQVIGKVHNNTKSALAMLEKQGFKFINEVDIFDAGPAYKSTTSEISAVRDSSVLPVKIGNPEQSSGYLLTNTELNFRAIIAPAEAMSDHLIISAETASLLHLTESNNIRYIIL